MVSNFIQKFWRGTRQAYNGLTNYDPHTHYSVLEEDKRWSIIYGVKKITSNGGQLEPVQTVVPRIENIAIAQQGDRFLVGTDAEGYKVIEIGPQNDRNSFYASEITPLGNFSVRVLDRGGKEYQIVDGVLKTYDDIDGGEF